MDLLLHTEFWIGLSSVCFFVCLFWYAVKPLNRIADSRKQDFIDELARFRALLAKAKDLNAYYERYFECAPLFEDKVTKAVMSKFEQKRLELLQQQKQYQNLQFNKLSQSLKARHHETNDRIERLLKKHIIMLVEMYLQQNADKYYLQPLTKRNSQAIQDFINCRAG